jgi:hypothetical protein
MKIVRPNWLLICCILLLPSPGAAKTACELFDELNNLVFQVRVTAAITQPALIARILEHQAVCAETSATERASAERGSPGLVTSHRFVDRGHRNGDLAD